jgi:AraC-like DNA-binding protein
MESLPLQHFRRTIAQFAVTREAHDMLFAGTGVSRDEFLAPDFVLTPALFWHVGDNVNAAVGLGWYYDMPVLWSSDVQGDLEAAMRFAPNLRTAFATVERHGSSRWTVAGWKAIWGRDIFCIGAHPTMPVPLVHWQMLSAMFGLNTETILEAAFPDVLPHVRHYMTGPPPRPAEHLAKVYRCPVQWNSQANYLTIPAHLLDTPSTIADSRQFSALIAGLDSRYESAPTTWSSKIGNVLGEHKSMQSGNDIAAKFGLSFRTMERRLAKEGTSFRQLTELRNKAAFGSLAKNSSLTLADIVTRMGYSDESALSRATRRWYGVTATVARRELQGR